MCSIINNNLITLRHEFSTLHTAALNVVLVDFPISLRLSNGNHVKIKAITGYIKTRSGAVASSARYVDQGNTFYNMTFNFRTFSGDEQKASIPEVDVLNTGVIIPNIDLGNIDIITNEYQQKFTFCKSIEAQDVLINVNMQCRGQTDATLLTVRHLLNIMFELE